MRPFAQNSTNQPAATACAEHEGSITPTSFFNAVGRSASTPASSTSGRCWIDLRSNPERPTSRRSRIDLWSHPDQPPVDSGSTSIDPGSTSGPAWIVLRSSLDRPPVDHGSTFRQDFIDLHRTLVDPGFAPDRSRIELKSPASPERQPTIK